MVFRSVSGLCDSSHGGKRFGEEEDGLGYKQTEGEMSVAIQIGKTTALMRHKNGLNGNKTMNRKWTLGS